MPLTIHNTLTQKKEAFQPQQPGEVRMYVCGITPYDTCHLGHARCYVVFDVIRRVFKHHGYKVRFVQNFTDVDDKIIARARERGIGTQELVRQNIEDFFNKMDALGVQRADIYPMATEHIPEIIALVRKLVEKGVAYQLGDDVYYSVRQYPSYGKLSRRPLDELQSGARIDVNKEKKDPLDFALWKGTKPDEPPEVSWDSPWGKGRPGWHIECSAMALKHLGADFDIHGGGLDLIFPHHENEIAQSEAATDLPFARCWIHNGFVTLNHEKMSKSTGNFFSLSDIFAKYQPSDVRYMLLSTHYRSPLNFSSDLLDQSRQAISGLMACVARATFVIRKQGKKMDQSDTPLPEVTTNVEKLVQNFHNALANDFNTVEALAVVHEVASYLEKQFASNSMHMTSIQYILRRLENITAVLGIDIFSAMHRILVPADVTELARLRQEARANKQWAEADRFRKEISELGYSVEDTPDGPRILPKAGN